MKSSLKIEDWLIVIMETSDKFPILLQNT